MGGCQTPDYLVRVHVGGRAAAGLKNIDNELIVILAIRDLVSGRRNRRCPVRWKCAEHAVRLSRTRLDQTQSFDELGLKAVPVMRKFSTARSVRAP